MTANTYASQFEFVRNAVHEEIKFNFLFDGQDSDFSDDQSLVGTGIVDPTGVIEIAMFLEEAYSIQVDEDDITPENFDTVNNITRYTLAQIANS